MPENQLMNPLDSAALQTLIDNAADGEQIRTLTREEISNTAHIVAEINRRSVQS